MLFDQLRKLSKTLRFRLTVWYTLVFFVALVVVFVAVQWGAKTGFLHDTDQRLIDDFKELESIVRQDYPNSPKIQISFDQIAVAHDSHGMFIHLADEKGKLILSNIHAPLTNFAFSPEKTGQFIETFEQNEQEKYTSIRFIQGHVTTNSNQHVLLRIGTSLKILEENLKQIQNILLTTGIVMLMISPLGGYWLASRATRPIADINMIARKLQPSRLTDRLPISGTHDELDELSIQINELLDRLAAYIDRQRTFTANAAHELRSPLAAIKNTMEIALHEHRTISEYQELLGTIGTECDHLHLLVNQLLTLAETESEHSSRVSQRVSLDKILTRSKEMFQAAAEDKHVHLSIERLDAVEIMGDPKQVRQVVNNLLDNAIKFNRENGRITMNLRVDPVNADAVLTISDTGSGIPSEDLPYLFERFFRGDKSHSRSQIQGNGLGLSICHAIVTSMQGKMSVTSQVNVGTTFVVTLPLSKSNSQPQSTPTSSS